MKRYIEIFALFTLMIFCGCIKSEEQAVLNVYNWANYIGKSTIADFESEYGVKVNYDNFSSNEELLAKIQAGATGYDVIFPSDYMVKIMIENSLLDELDHEQIPNLVNIDLDFLSPSFDPGNKFSIPYFWGVTGLAVNTRYVGGTVDSWNVLWDERFSGRISMLDDAREGMLPALRVLGFDINTTDLGQIQKAKELMIKQKPLVKAYNSYTYPELLRSDSVWIAQSYTGGAHEAASGKPEIKFIVPKEGSNKAIDSMCIPKFSVHKGLALKFIDFILRKEVGAAIANEIRFPTPNRAARKLVREDLLNDPSIYPPKDVMDHLYWLKDIGRGQLVYDRAWNELKAR